MIAIIAAFNEADIIGQVVGDLIGQGVEVYLLDHGSTDGTAAAVEPYLGRGLRGIERLDREGEGASAPERFSLEAIMRRKEALAAELPASWFINHDADEFRESPWPGLTLAAAIRAVDVLDYNAIDFELLNFWPTHDRFKPGDDPREAFVFYEGGRAWDKVQIRCWKKTAAAVELASSGGHEARFPGRRVFPVRFILRHYPIRSQAHGERKIFRERRSRFAEGERARGWHVQYEGMREGESLLRDPAGLVRYDPDAVRLGLALEHRGVEELRATLAELRATLTEREQALAEREQTLEEARSEVERFRRDVDGLAAEVGRLARLLDDLHASRSWRWTAPLRAAHRALLGH